MEDLALLLSVHEDTVRSMLARGELPGVRIGRRWYVRRAALDAPFITAENRDGTGDMLP